MGSKLIYIRNPRTGEFLRKLNRWVVSPEEAKRFSSALRAYQFASENQVPEVEIVFQKASRIESVLRDVESNKPSSTGSR